ncbi:hypothetical protein JZO73_03815 [Enterococcus plantarum]|uniref:hypothetical protein n=1 Tax=Enterococcus plantarum TaxID=1077675 RepID=UPI001A8F93AD|nr:hypothetical protein [Enterococcus plantarum]MBO0466656.1 hypothetical protein [Enterococcus plantarum]
MKKNFYNNPIKLIWIARNSLLPSYLMLIWLLIILFLFFGTFVFNYIELSSFSIDKYFSASTTGLTFTLALFTAEKNVFKIDELKAFADYVDKEGKNKGKPLLDFLAPFVFTSLVFLITGTLSLIVPFINVNVSDKVAEMLIQVYLNLLLLGLFGLFNLVVTMLNDVYHSVSRE